MQPSHVDCLCLARPPLTQHSLPNSLCLYAWLKHSFCLAIYVTLLLARPSNCDRYSFQSKQLEHRFDMASSVATFQSSFNAMNWPDRFMRLKQRFERYEMQTSMLINEHEDRLNAISSALVSARIFPEISSNTATHRGPGALPAQPPSRGKAPDSAKSPGLFDWDAIEDKEMRKATSVSLGTDT